MREFLKKFGPYHWTEFGLIAAIIAIGIVAIVPHVPWRAIFGG